jgi:hypothetical protein
MQKSHTVRGNFVSPRPPQHPSATWSGLHERDGRFTALWQRSRFTVLRPCSTVPRLHNNTRSNHLCAPVAAISCPRTNHAGRLPERAAKVMALRTMMKCEPRPIKQCSIRKNGILGTSPNVVLPPVETRPAFARTNPHCQNERADIGQREAARHLALKKHRLYRHAALLQPPRTCVCSNGNVGRFHLCVRVSSSVQFVGPTTEIVRHLLVESGSFSHRRAAVTALQQLPLGDTKLHRRTPQLPAGEGHCTSRPTMLTGRPPST